MKTRSLLALSAVCACALVADGATPRVTRKTVTSARLPDRFDGFRIAQISDYHSAPLIGGQRMLCTLVAYTDPDVIFVTGDLFDSRHTDIPTALALVRHLAHIAPVFFVPGNHESRFANYAEIRERIADAGATVLEDEAVLFGRGDGEIRVAGLSDPAFSDHEHNRADRERMTDEKLCGLLAENPGVFTVLLAHRPELFSVYAKHEIDLVFAGHAHGGQFRLPWIGGLYAPDQGVLPKYTSGSYRENGTEMIVSRGIGNSRFPLRFNNPPEIVLTTLRKE